jgi:hypothetical protein
MRYLVCEVDGTLREGGRRGDRLNIINEEVGPEGWDRIRIRTGPFVGMLAAFANDCGLLMPERYPRNVVGSCLLAVLGANMQPYAGPLVLTGWDDSDPAIEVCGLSEPIVIGVREAHAAVLGGGRRRGGGVGSRAAAPQHGPPRSRRMTSAGSVMTSTAGTGASASRSASSRTRSSHDVGMCVSPSSRPNAIRGGHHRFHRDDVRALYRLIEDGAE